MLLINMLAHGLRSLLMVYKLISYSELIIVTGYKGLGSRVLPAISGNVKDLMLQYWIKS